jgi:hypothetical protein
MTSPAACGRGFASVAESARRGRSSGRLTLYHDLAGAREARPAARPADARLPSSTPALGQRRFHGRAQSDPRASARRERGQGSNRQAVGTAALDARRCQQFAKPALAPLLEAVGRPDTALLVRKHECVVVSSAAGEGSAARRCLHRPSPPVLPRVAAPEGLRAASLALPSRVAVGGTARPGAEPVGRPRRTAVQESTTRPRTKTSRALLQSLAPTAARDPPTH